MTNSRQQFPRPLARVSGTKWGSRLTEKVYTPLDKALYRMTRGRFGLSPRNSVLYLTTTGRKSGLPRQVPVLFLRDGDRVWVVASNFGRDHHPAWSSNLLANPDATVHIRGKERRVRARLATAEEKEKLWPRLVELYPAWKQYTRWTDRDFRLFCLE